ncbi:MAG: division/cell wall cluster transcriptional repressor MraZ [Verrucomicrobiae bacterium]|nr:division/cell wall cluster transcriptional repressor MraZ [Verrucomicrobiae bacterium]
MNPQLRFFTDRFDHGIDSVSRIVIPSDWRIGDTEEFYVFPSEKGRLVVLTKEELRKKLDEMEKISSAAVSPREKNDRMAALMSNASTVICDKQGRITVKTKLLEHLGLKPKENVLLVGCGLWFEIWNSGAYQQRTDYDAVRESLGF